MFQTLIFIHFVFSTFFFSHLNGSYLSADGFASDKDMSTIVPRILHFVWIVQPIPDKYLDAITEFENNNPDYEV